MALTQDASRPQLAYPERVFVEKREAAVSRSMRRAGASVGALLGAGAAMVWMAHRKKAA
ncbi:MAG TPA: hypothetical protein VKE93_00850 [Candidatus Angelobacter sp.]|nr:hypothetical protein [Candidatus Angelobacter sp.]